MQLDPTAFLANPESIRALSEPAIPVVCDTDRVLFCQGDPPVGLYILHSGQVSLSMTANDGQTILSVRLRDGSLLGLPGLLSNQPYSLRAVAHAGARVSFLDRTKFTALMETSPTLAFNILQVLAAEVRSARQVLY